MQPGPAYLKEEPECPPHTPTAPGSPSQHDGRLKLFVEAIARWREISETNTLPFVDTIISTPVKDINAITHPCAVPIKSTLLDILEAFDGSRNIMVKHAVHVGEKPVVLVFNRLSFLEHALQALSLLQPLSSIVEQISPLAWVGCDDTLDVVLERMISSGFEEVGVTNGGILVGVLHLDDVIKYVLHQMMVLGYETKGTDFNGQKYLRQSIQEFRARDKIYGGKHLRRENEVDEQSLSPLRHSALDWCKNGFTELFIVFCLLLDLICAVVEWNNQNTDEVAAQKLTVATGIILFVYLFERTVRNFAYGRSLLSRPMEAFDNSVIVVSVIVYILVLVAGLEHESKSVMTVVRIVRILRVLKIVRIFMRLLADRKMRYNEDGFCLDLAFITNSCVAMSLPVFIRDNTFRNQINEVLRFFSTKYPSRYLIVNLCAEKTYPEEFFGGRVMRIEVAVNQPPKMQQIVSFVEHGGRFLDEHPRSCLAVHCSVGEGRTGVMISSWLLYSTFSSTADDAMKWFATRWTGRRNSKIKDGIRMASQRRYVHYMQDALMAGGFYTHRLHLLQLVIQKCPSLDGQGGCNLWFAIEEDGETVLCSAGDEMQNFSKMVKGQEEMIIPLDILLAGDIRITCYHRQKSGDNDFLCFSICFHTGFVRTERETLQKGDIDIAEDDWRCKFFDKNFSVHLEFDQCFPSSPASFQGQTPLPRNGAAVGPFQKIERPSAEIIEAASQMRCRDLTVQSKFANKLEGVVGMRKFFEPLPSVAVHKDDAPVESLCCATGPIVMHSEVHLFKIKDGAMNRTRWRESSLYSGSLMARPLQGFARNLVSGNKRRFSEAGFDLDLTYVTPRVIAMGFPSRGLESHYRNSEADVYRFFQERHAAHYLIVNLCSERGYELDTFHGNCVRYPFPDHNPPALELLLPCCARIHAFLQADADNVAAIHCKAGKGRTGTVVASYLIYCGFLPTANEARHFYDNQRTKDGKGLTIVSQIRYVHYFEQVLRVIKAGGPPLELSQNRAPAVRLLGIRLHTLPRLGGRGCIDLMLVVDSKSEIDHAEYTLLRSGLGPNGEAPVNHTGSHFILEVDSELGRCDMRFGPGIRVAGDFHLIFYDKDVFANMGKAMHVWLHSAFLTSPPSDMGGISRAATDCSWAVNEVSPTFPAASAGVGPGASPSLTSCLPENGAVVRSLLLRKHEVDIASKDKRCMRFDADFAMEIFYTMLPGEQGTGPSLDAARYGERLVASTLQPDESFRAEADWGPRAVGSPLQYEREGYRLAAQRLADAGREVPPFDIWVLRGDRDFEDHHHTSLNGEIVALNPPAVEVDSEKDRATAFA